MKPENENGNDVFQSVTLPTRTKKNNPSSVDRSRTYDLLVTSPGALNLHGIICFFMFNNMKFEILGIVES